MTTCAECVHVGVCRDYILSLSKAKGKDIDESKLVKLETMFDTDGCEHFKDRSRFVKLPCRVSGDCFFVNQNGTIQRATLERVYMFSTSTELFLNDGREIYSTSLNESNIELFPTYEEAEQALKERDINLFNTSLDGSPSKKKSVEVIGNIHDIFELWEVE